MRWPRPTIRLRLTALYGGVFLLTGAVLLTLGYFIVRHNVGARPNFATVRFQLHKAGIDNQLRREGIVPPPDAAFPAPGQFGQLRFAPGSPERRLALIVDTQLRNNALRRLLVEYLIALGGMTLISVMAGWLLAGRALRPLRRITATAQRVSAENLGERIALRGPEDELMELADTFDRMLGRLEATFESQRHFVANASHELRTPLAIMRTEIDVALADPEARPDELRRMGEAVRETIDRCERLIEGLLTLARSEASTGHEQRLDVAALAGDCVTDLTARAQEANVEIQSQLEPAWTRSEPALLERMIANLIDNGIRHNHAGGWLSVRTRALGAVVRLEVANSGPVISPADVARLTEPFRRLGRGQGGFGLGLSIVSSVVKAHRGRLMIEAPASGGLAVRIELPAAPAADAAPQLTASQESPALTRS